MQIKTLFTYHHTCNMAPPPASLVFKVHRREPELIPPAKPTPREVKPLSDIDDQEGLRSQVPIIQFYGHDPSMKGKDPVSVIREAIAEALVFYFPFAGRLRELERQNRKLVVDCTGEGVMFIEADADVTLDQFGDALQPPFPCLEELLFNVPGSDGLLHSPLLLIQVTRLKCGGLIFALRLNHTISDGAGLVQFLMAVSEISRGAHYPSVLPVWERHLLSARTPPRITCTHHEYDEVANANNTIIPVEDMAHRSFFFGPDEIAAIRQQLPVHLQNSSTFEILTSFLWRLRSIALQPDPSEAMRVICIVNARTKFSPPLPVGYYGNVLAHPVALSTVDKLCENPLGYALELVRKAKADVTEEYMRSVADLMVIKGRPAYSLIRTYLVSDVTRTGLTSIDFGWGKPIYGGPAKGTVASFHIPVRNKKGEDGILVPIYLPTSAMEKFMKELENVLKTKATNNGNKQSVINSAL